MYNLSTKKLFSASEYDGEHIGAGYKGIKIDGKDGWRAVLGRRGLPRISGRGAYEKGTPMVTVVYWRVDKTERDCVVYNVHKSGKKLADVVYETVEPGSVIHTDEYGACDSLEKRASIQQKYPIFLELYWVWFTQKSIGCCCRTLRASPGQIRVG